MVWWPRVCPVMLMLTCLFGYLDWLRLRDKRWNRVYCYVMGFILREKEIDRYSSTFWYVSGITATMLIFTKRNVILLSFWYLSWCDPFAAIIGTLFGGRMLSGKIPRLPNGKSIEGMLSACLLGSILAYLLLNCTWSKALLCGLIAMTSEACSLPNWDDNFTLPLISASLLNFII
jgi:diacylglycerol kinase (CTP)